MRHVLVLTMGLGGLFLLSGCGTTEPRQLSSGVPKIAPRQQGGGNVVPRPAPSVAPESWEAEADRWMGTPYRIGGADRQGIDCSGFTGQIYRRVALIQLPRRTIDQYHSGRAVPMRDLQPGDLVFFVTSGISVSHVGVIVSGDRFAHASTSQGVMYSRLSEDYWSRHYVGARRLR